MKFSSLNLYVFNNFSIQLTQNKLFYLQQDDQSMKSLFRSEDDVITIANYRSELKYFRDGQPA